MKRKISFGSSKCETPKGRMIFKCIMKEYSLSLGLDYTCSRHWWAAVVEIRVTWNAEKFLKK